jgi:hypothetical protein
MNEMNIQVPKQTFSLSTNYELLKEDGELRSLLISKIFGQ